MLTRSVRGAGRAAHFVGLLDTARGILTGQATAGPTAANPGQPSPALPDPSSAGERLRWFLLPGEEQPGKAGAAQPSSINPRGAAGVGAAGGGKRPADALSAPSRPAAAAAADGSRPAKRSKPGRGGGGQQAAASGKGRLKKVTKNAAAANFASPRFHKM